MTQDFFQSVCETARRAAVYHSIADTLEWDERTQMPRAAGEFRATQVAELRSAAHRLRTSTEYGDQLAELDSNDNQSERHSDHSAIVRCLHRDWQRDCKLPTEFVAELSVATSRGQQLWEQAREEDSFAVFRDALDTVIQLKREAGARMSEGTDRTNYEALLDEYEPDASIADLNPVFSDLKSRLTELIKRIGDAPRRPNVDLLRREFPVDDQRAFSEFAAEAVGFDFQRGRLDETVHPFCTTLGPNDCRILTRYDAHWFPTSFYGTLHEAGHGLYEQGLRSDQFGLPSGSYTSLGIHESQSRLWENQVGRSRAFWTWLYPEAVRRVPSLFDGVSIDELYFAINNIEPSLIRVEADEATYNLHILIRFELEQALIDGALTVDDLPQAWDDEYERCLGIRASSPKQGVLQDVHWSCGLIGYFPTYTLGNLAAAQLFAAAEQQLGDLATSFEKGEFSGLLEWLRDNVHRHGRNYSGAELVQNATGASLSADSLMQYLEAKLAPLYGI
ncbi:MAG: carboxypeptidase M32 [Planctomycetota bacterium]